MKFEPDHKTKELYKALLSLKDESELNAFLRDLLTAEELKEFSNRWKVAQMLSAKKTYVEIESETGMSSTTIARISKWLEHGMDGYKLVIKRLYGKQL
ncbi:MAG: hypothetical protein KA035_00205 [Candidatus Levybacteria bacterium]|nr:hypothetical protein [Candidatus Levybacteria bacterium]